MLAALVGVSWGCSEPERSSFEDGSTDGNLGDAMPDDFPAGSCRTSSGTSDDCETGTSTGDASTSAAASTGGDQCEASGDCEGAGSCVAAWDDGARGAFACQFTCVPSLDETAWCRDTDACCDPEATCTSRGYCAVLPGSDKSSGGKLGGTRISDAMPEDLPAGGDPSP
jgi:hypothetical protein